MKYKIKLPTEEISDLAPQLRDGFISTFTVHFITKFALFTSCTIANIPFRAAKFLVKKVQKEKNSIKEVNHSPSKSLLASFFLKTISEIIKKFLMTANLVKNSVLHITDRISRIFAVIKQPATVCGILFTETVSMEFTFTTKELS